MKVEIEVPQTCSFIVRTTGCRLSEVANMDAEGNPVFGPAPSSDAFAVEMEKYPLKVVVEGVYDVKLYPEDGETTTILNIKRGIISALAVPLLEEDKNRNMPTIHGICKTHYSINTREDIATDVSLTRDLSKCDKFIPMRDHTSPLALITGMHYPLAQLLRSSQSCNYKFDNEKKHMTSGSCTENHILIPFSHNGEYGVTNVGKQEVTLVQVSPHNERVFECSDIVKGLHMEAVEDKNAVQDKDAGLNLLNELATLPETEGERRAHLFHKLVTMVRGMKAETLSPAIPEALAMSRVLTYQVLVQCGTPECSSAIMQILRTFDSSSLEVDASVFAMGLISNPSALLINDMLEMAKYKHSKPIMYALSNVVKRYYKAEGKLIPEIHSVADCRLGSILLSCPASTASPPPVTCSTSAASPPPVTCSTSAASPPPVTCSTSAASPPPVTCSTSAASPPPSLSACLPAPPTKNSETMTLLTYLTMKARESEASRAASLWPDSLEARHSPESPFEGSRLAMFSGSRGGHRRQQGHHQRPVCNMPVSRPASAASRLPNPWPIPAPRSHLVVLPTPVAGPSSVVRPTPALPAGGPWPPAQPSHPWTLVQLCHLRPQASYVGLLTNLRRGSALSAGLLPNLLNCVPSVLPGLMGRPWDDHLNCFTLLVCPRDARLRFPCLVPLPGLLGRPPELCVLRYPPGLLKRPPGRPPELCSPLPSWPAQTTSWSASRTVLPCPALH
ncbi:apolipoprotein B-100-like, partial [Micropterus dolomieu]|uniref:apolipoprotein B-100-like n=1 Tax=Micropterus dolomieu TaxID=147949 RepID=UPI001E8E00FC